MGQERTKRELYCLGAWTYDFYEEMVQTEVVGVRPSEAIDVLAVYRESRPLNRGDHLVAPSSLFYFYSTKEAEQTHRMPEGLDQPMLEELLHRDDIERYNNQFNELALMCLDLVKPKKKKIKRYIRGLPEIVKTDEKKLEDIPIIRDLFEVFSDDLSGLPHSKDKHEFHLKMILELLKKEKLYAKFSKCEFWLQDVQFLMHVVNRDGIHVDPSKVESVKNWKTLELPIEIRSFLGLAGYYQRFIENFSKIAKPFTLLTQKNKKGKVIAYASRQLKVYKNNYTTRDLELGEASKDLKALEESLRGLDAKFKRRDNGRIYFVDRIWIPSVSNIKKLIMDEAHTSKYSVHLGADKMYYDLRDLYWWPGMKKDIAEYVSKCLTYSKIKVEHQNTSRLLQQPKIHEWK
nr:hypothetical protein [Tanacetum cinerariifolium]